MKKTTWLSIYTQIIEVSKTSYQASLFSMNRRKTRFALAQIERQIEDKRLDLNYNSVRLCITLAREFNKKQIEFFKNYLQIKQEYENDIQNS